jgi:tRNA G10  N-methylase Trm11
MPKRLSNPTEVVSLLAKYKDKIDPAIKKYAKYPVDYGDESLDSIGERVSKRQRKFRKEELRHVKQQAYDVYKARKKAKPRGKWGPWCEKYGLSLEQADRYVRFWKLVVTTGFFELSEEEQWQKWQEVQGNVSREDRRARLAEKQAARLEREEQRLVTENISIGPEQPTCDIRRGDFRECWNDLAPGSVDLIFTDPPYGDEFLELWELLGALAARALRPGGLLVTYISRREFTQVVKAIGGHLRDVWIGCTNLPGQAARIYPRKIFTTCKPLFVYTTRGALDPRQGEWASDYFEGGPPNKTLHKWQQDLNVAKEVIRRFSEPGELVLDPMVGSGTAAVAAISLGRNFLGGDIDQKAVATTLRRVRKLLRRSQQS